MIALSELWLSCVCVCVCRICCKTVIVCINCCPSKEFLSYLLMFTQKLKKMFFKAVERCHQYIPLLNRRMQNSNLKFNKFRTRSQTVTSHFYINAQLCFHAPNRSGSMSPPQQLLIEFFFTVIFHSFPAVVPKCLSTGRDDFTSISHRGREWRRCPHLHCCVLFSCHWL